MKRSELDQYIYDTLLADYQKLYRLAYSYVGNQEDAMDVVQESAYKAIKKSDKVKNKEFVGTWIYRIVINTATDLLRKRRKEQIGVEDYQSSGYEDRYTDYDMMNSLKHLNEKDRTVIVLRFFEDLKLSQIAQITDENLNTVKSRLYRGLRTLKLELSDG